MIINLENECYNFDVLLMNCYPHNISLPVNRVYRCLDHHSANQDTLLTVVIHSCIYDHEYKHTKYFHIFKSIYIIVNVG